MAPPPPFELPFALNALAVGGEGALAALDEYLSTRSYVVGYSPSALDTSVFDALRRGCSDAEADVLCPFPHVRRWRAHMDGLGEDLRKRLPVLAVVAPAEACVAELTCRPACEHHHNTPQIPYLSTV